MVWTSLPRKISVPFAVLVVGLCLLDGSIGRRHGQRWRGYLPKCGGGESFFSDFMKCDASISYCFEYRNDSCVGPDNWVCVHNLNRKADLVDSETDIFEKNAGYGNTRCCGGQRQSPIDIPADDAVCQRDLPTPYFLNPWIRLTGTFENSGYYSKFFVEADKYNHPLVLSGVPFTCSMYRNDKYVFSNIHIHTGIKDKHGSAHFVEGKTYDGEFHIVHVHSTFYKPGKIDMRCASQSPLGLAVVGVFLSLTEGKPNAELNRLLTEDNLDKIKETHAKCDYEEICDPDDDNDGGDYGDDDDICDDSSSSEEYGADSGEYFGGFDDRRKKRDVNGVGRRDGRYDGDDGGESGEGRQKWKCLCRRRSYEEELMYWAKRGEELQCRNKYISGVAMEDQGSHHVPCNQHAAGSPCGDGIVEDFHFRPGLLLPRNREYYQYFGSLTTPPCSEVVNWIMMKEPIRITKEQLDRLQKLESRHEDEHISKYGDVRPVQPVNGRTIVTNSC